MSKRAVLLIVRAHDFRPQTVGDIPSGVFASRVYEDGLTYCQALQKAQSHNQGELAKAFPSSWLVIASKVKPPKVSPQTGPVPVPDPIEDTGRPSASEPVHQQTLAVLVPAVLSPVGENFPQRKNVAKGGA